jgi:hypothetical protein
VRRRGKAASDSLLSSLSLRHLLFDLLQFVWLDLKGTEGATINDKGSLIKRHFCVGECDIPDLHFH